MKTRRACRTRPNDASKSVSRRVERRVCEIHCGRLVNARRKWLDRVGTFVRRRHERSGAAHTWKRFSKPPLRSSARSSAVVSA